MRALLDDPRCLRPQGSLSQSASVAVPRSFLRTTGRQDCASRRAPSVSTRCTWTFRPMKGLVRRARRPSPDHRPGRCIRIRPGARLHHRSAPEPGAVRSRDRSDQGSGGRHPATGCHVSNDERGTVLKTVPVLRDVTQRSSRSRTSMRSGSTSDSRSIRGKQNLIAARHHPGVRHRLQPMPIAANATT